MESTCQRLWIRENGSKITDQLEIVDDHKRHTCDKCRKEKSVKEFMICSSKFSPKLKVCKRYVKYVVTNVEKKMKDAKEVSLNKNGTGMGI